MSAWKWQLSKIQSVFLVKTQFWQTKLGFLSFALEKFLELCQNGFFEFKCGLSWNKQPILHLVRVSRESGILVLKNENPCFENFSGVPGSWFRLEGGEESQGFSEVKNSKFENGFLTMSSLDHKLSRTIFSFAIGWVEIKIFQFWDIGWKLKSHNWSSEKSQNGFFLITSSRLLEPIATYGIEFGWVKLILWSFEDSPVTGSRGGEESQEDSLKITTCKNFLKAWVFK
jgi:hypothetical protein